MGFYILKIITIATCIYLYFTFLSYILISWKLFGHDIAG